MSKSQDKKIGILGGTFDPPHIGHLMLAERARDQLGLSRVLFVPAGAPPHKLGQVRTPVEHRVAMINLAIASNPYFELSRVDIDRPAPSYSADMLRILHEQYGAGTDLYFIIGMDSLHDIIGWHEPERVIELCYLVVAQRPGYDVDIEELETRLPGSTKRIYFISMPLVGASSGRLRRWTRNGESITYWVPPEVEQYIAARGLYR